MLHFKLTEEQANSVAGVYGENQIQPRLALDGFYYIPVSCASILNIAEDFYPSAEVEASDFPASEI
jgi:hypothetical protein